MKALFRSMLLGVSAAIAIFILHLGAPAQAEETPSFKTAGNTAIYLGVVPAQLALAHPPGHPERMMHGSERAGRHEYHLLVALYDAKSGARIEDAEVSAVISGLGHVGLQTLQFEPMKIADTVTYGAFATLPGADQYAIAVEVRRSGQAPARTEFNYRHPLR